MDEEKREEKKKRKGKCRFDEGRKQTVWDNNEERRLSREVNPVTTYGKEKEGPITVTRVIYTVYPRNGRKRRKGWTRRRKGRNSRKEERREERKEERDDDDESGNIYTNRRMIMKEWDDSEWRG